MYLGILFVLETMTRVGFGLPIDPLYFYMVYTLIIASDAINAMRKKDQDPCHSVDYECFFYLLFLLSIHLISYPPLTIASVLLMGIYEIWMGREKSLRTPLAMIFCAFMINLSDPASMFAFNPSQIYYILFSTNLMVTVQLKTFREWMIKETQGDDKLDHLLLNLCDALRLFLLGRLTKNTLFVMFACRVMYIFKPEFPKELQQFEPSSSGLVFMPSQSPSKESQQSEPSTSERSSILGNMFLSGIFNEVFSGCGILAEVLLNGTKTNGEDPDSLLHRDGYFRRAGS